MSAGGSVHFEKERGVSEIRVQRGLAHAVVRLCDAQERLALLQALAGASVPVFLVKLHPGCGLSFAVREDEVERCAKVLGERGAEHSLYRDLGLVTTLAGAMRDLSGVMAAIYEAMVKAGVRVRQTGDAYNAVLCLVDGSDAERAAEALREEFGLTAGSAKAALPVGAA